MISIMAEAGLEGGLSATPKLSCNASENQSKRTVAALGRLTPLPEIDFQIGVESRDYHYQSQSEIGGNRISRQ